MPSRPSGKATWRTAFLVSISNKKFEPSLVQCTKTDDTLFPVYSFDIPNLELGGL